MLVFVEGGKPEYLEKNPCSRDEKQQQTQPMYDAETGNRTRATLVRGECSHHCTIPAPQIQIQLKMWKKIIFKFLLPPNTIHSSICDFVVSITLSFGTTLSTNPMASASSAVYLLLLIIAFSAMPLPTTLATLLKTLVKDAQTDINLHVLILTSD